MAQHVPSPKELFDSALEIASPSERRAYLDRACADAPDVRKKVEALLKAHEEAGSFMARPAGAVPAVEAVVRVEPSSRVDAETIDHPAVGDAPLFGDQAGTHIGRYQLLEKLGEGGMGAVYRAEQEKPVRRQVALKIIKPGMGSAQVVARFESERQALTMMDHLSIARVLDAGATKSGLPYFVMELVKGEPLTRFCDDNLLNVRQRLELFVQVCHAIQHAHQKGIIHRDIKPSNCLVTLYEGRPIPKVIDFGLAKAIGGQQLSDGLAATQIGSILGTPAYMSPEQADFGVQDIDTRTDIYSLGVMLYELLTGTTPLGRSGLKGATGSEILRRIREEEPPRPSARLLELGAGVNAVAEQRGTRPDRLTKTLRGELDWIVLKALEKDRKRRYGTALDFANDVQGYLDDEPVKACPPSARYRLGKFARKHRALLVGACGVLLFLLGTLVVLLVSNDQVTTALAAETKALAEKSALLTQTRQMFGLANDLTGLALPKQARYGDVERRQLAKLLASYEKVARALGDSREGREIGAEGQSRIASIHAFLGEYDKANAGFRHAIDLYSKLLAEFPKTSSYGHELSVCHVGLANTLRYMGRLPEAETAYREAVAVAAKLMTDFPTTHSLHDLAEAQNGLGLICCDLAIWDKAREAFERAIALWEKRGDKRVDRYNLAVGYNNLILATRGLGTGSETAYQKVDELLNQLADDSPSSPEIRFLRAQSYNNLGLIRWSGQQWTDAESAYRLAIDLGKSLTHDYGAVPDYWVELARGQFGLALCLNQQGNLPAAAAAYRQSIDLWKKIDIRNVPRYQINLASNTCNNLGALLSDQEKLAEAKEAFELAIDLQEKLTRAFPTIALYRINLGGTSSNLANVLRDLGKPQDALPWYDKAKTLLGAAAAEAGAAPNARLFLRNTCWDRANTLGQLVRHAEAVKDWERAIALDDGADRDALKCFLATAREELNLKTAPPAAADLRYQAARTFGQGSKAAADKKDPSLQKQYARRALELLQEAKSGGHFRKAARIAELKNDLAFLALRDDADFRSFVVGLAEGKE